MKLQKELDVVEKRLKDIAGNQAAIDAIASGAVDMDLRAFSTKK